MTKWGVPSYYQHRRWSVTVPEGNPFGGAGHVASKPSTAWRDRTGFVVHLLSATLGTATTQLQGIAATGAGWIRSDIAMHLVNPSSGTFDWSATDPIFTAAANSGVKVLGILDYCATWANGSSDIFHQATNLSDWVTYATAVVDRYGTTGSFWTDNPSLPKVPLAAVELWNEPWLNRFWKPDPDPVAYAALVRAAAPALHAADPHLTVVMSLDWLQFRSDSSQPEFGTAVLAADSTVHTLVDAYNVHVYSSPKSLGVYAGYYNARLASFRYWITRDNMRALGKEKPIWITEIGWKTVGSSEVISEADASTNYIDVLTRSFQEWEAEKCFLYFYGIRDASNDDYCYGMLREDGTATAAIGAITTYLAG